ncbi:MAG: ABC transporter ATP-binding protein [Firmicutes bacterium]|nr:ABC transporter ATP-binding protein [Bacillota bacterium]
MEKDIALSVKDLSVEYDTDTGTVYAVNHVSFDVERGQTLGLVGETGAGKTSIALAIMQLLPVPPAVIPNGEIIFDGVDLIKQNKKQLRAIRGNQISMIFQDPMTALNPVDTVGEQILEVIRLHEKCSAIEAKEKAEAALELVGIPKERYGEYPHQFSGGMKQRIVIAIALACHPEFLIADEPTTALDVTIQAQVLHLINELKEKRNTTNILITHDLGVVAEMCDKVAVIYAGRVVEIGTLRNIFKETAHPYTQGLFDSLPDINSDTEGRLKPIEGMMPDPSIRVNGCPFADRCKYRTAECTPELTEEEKALGIEYNEIELTHLGGEHYVRCIRPLDKEAAK